MVFFGYHRKSYDYIINEVKEEFIVSEWRMGDSKPDIVELSDDNDEKPKPSVKTG